MVLLMWHSITMTSSLTLVYSYIELQFLYHSFRTLTISNLQGNEATIWISAKIELQNKINLKLDMK